MSHAKSTRVKWHRSSTKAADTDKKRKESYLLSFKPGSTAHQRWSFWRRTTTSHPTFGALEWSLASLCSLATSILTTNTPDICSRASPATQYRLLSIKVTLSPRMISSSRSLRGSLTLTKSVTSASPVLMSKSLMWATAWLKRAPSQISPASSANQALNWWIYWSRCSKLILTLGPQPNNYWNIKYLIALGKNKTLKWLLLLSESR